MRFKMRLKLIKFLKKNLIKITAIYKKKSHQEFCSELFNTLKRLIILTRVLHKQHILQYLFT